MGSKERRNLVNEKSIDDAVIGKIAGKALKIMVPSIVAMYISLPKMMMYSQFKETPDFETSALLGGGLIGFTFGGLLMAGAYLYKGVREEVEKEYKSKD